MNIGYIYEGKYDKKTLEIILRKIVEVCTNSSLEFTAIQGNGPITEQVKLHIPRMELIGLTCSIVIADTDNNPKKQKIPIEKWVSKYQREKHPETPIILSFPDPSLEAWYCDEETAVKKVLGIPPSGALPHPALKNRPKERVRMLIADYQKRTRDIIYTPLDLYTKFAEEMNIHSRLILANSSFKKLSVDIKSLLGD